MPQIIYRLYHYMLPILKLVRMRNMQGDAGPKLELPHEKTNNVVFE